jgi:hypothetical protein
MQLSKQDTFLPHGVGLVLMELDFVYGGCVATSYDCQSVVVHSEDAVVYGSHWELYVNLLPHFRLKAEALKYCR